MFERLTRRIGDTVEFVDGKGYAKLNYSDAQRLLFNRLAAYEDSGLSPEQVRELAEAKADGRLVVLPCKPETKVYRVWKVSGREPVIDEYYAGLRFIVDHLDKFGKTVFLTREAAEKAIAEGVGE